MRCLNCDHSGSWDDGQPCPRCGVRNINLSFSDHLEFQSELTAALKRETEMTGLKHEADSPPRSISVDLNRETSAIAGSIRASTRLNESANQEVYRGFLEHGSKGPLGGSDHTPRAHCKWVPEKVRGQ